MYMYIHVECRGFESHPRQLIFSRKSDCLEGTVLLCLVCLLDLACFFLSSFSSLMYMYMGMVGASVVVCGTYWVVVVPSG